MSQINHGIRALLEKPTFYKLFQWAIGANRCKKKVIQKFVRPKPNMVLLDIGCGPGNIANLLPATVKYYGFDINQDYINYAKKRFSHATFVCNDVNNEELLNQFPKFDIVVAFGLLHHLDDSEVLKLMNSAKRAMKQNGRLITLDNCTIANQSRIARFVIERDRGQNVRTQEGYEFLARKVFSNIKSTISHDLLWFPYTFIIMECS